MRLFLMTLILSFTGTALATQNFDSLESLLQSEGMTTHFPNFFGANLPLLTTFSSNVEVAQAYCDLQNRKLLTYTSDSIDFPETGESWVYDSSEKIFVKKKFDYSAYKGAHTRDILTSVTCGAPIFNCEVQ